MTRETDTWEDMRQIVSHRLATHVAALRAWEALGKPDRLRYMVVRTEARMSECNAFLADLDALRAPCPPLPVDDGASPDVAAWEDEYQQSRRRMPE